MQRRWQINLGINLGVWTLVAIFWTTVIYLHAVPAPPLPPDVGWAENAPVQFVPKPARWFGIFVNVAPPWALWALATPLILRLGRRFFIEPECWQRRALLHLSFSIVWLVIYIVALIGIDLVRHGAPFSAFRSFAPRTFNEQVYFDYFIYWMILAVGHLTQYYRRYRQKEREAFDLRLHNSQLETQLVQAQLQTLKSQLNPHFLFNTLNSISALVRQDDRKAAVRMVALLSELLRQTIDRDHSQLVSLADEAEFLRSYLGIQQIRYERQLRVVWQLEPEALSAALPNMILQPLVENAIKHGIAENLTMGQLRVHAERLNGRLCLEVSNDGPCLPADWNWERHAGLGLTNTRERLRTLYGEDFTLELCNAGNAGVAATLAIPFRPHENGGAS